MNAKPSSANAASSFEVGQQLWVVWTMRGQAPSFETISKVGRELLTIKDGRYRVRISNMVVEQGSCKDIAQCYRTKEEHDEVLLRGKAWSELRRLMSSYAAPAHVTTEQLQAMIATLKGPAGNI